MVKGNLQRQSQFFYEIEVLHEKRGEEQNKEEGEMAQKKLGGGRNRGEK